MTKILTSDILIADVMSSYINNKDIQALTTRLRLQPGGKEPLSREQLDEFQRAVEGHHPIIVPGGSAANMLTTLSKLMGKETQVTMLGVIGNEYHDIIRKSLDEAGITLIPETLPEDVTPETGISHIVVFPDGQRTIVTYPGNAKAILKSSLITNRLVEDHDVLLVQGSLWQKLDWDFADRLMTLRWEHDKELWLALPTHTKFGVEKAGLFQWLIPSANLVLGNEEELCRIYQTDIDSALHRLQNEFRKEVPYQENHHPRREQVAFITRGENGCAIVTKKDICYLPARAVGSEEGLVNTLGAGDTAFAGFAAGYVKNLSPQNCAQIAMALANEKLKVYGPRLPDPKAALRQAAPHLARMLDQARSESLVPSK